VPLFPGIVPKQGEIYMCNFSGYVVPEIVKLRRAIVVSPPNRGAKVVLVVPVSTTPPRFGSPVQVRLPGEDVYECFAGVQEVWVKADLISHVSFARLDRVHVRGKGFLRTVKLSNDHLKDVQRAILHALGLGDLCWSGPLDVDLDIPF
jgi:mRNA interferase MazF